MATHSGILDWKIPWTEEPGGLYSSESQELDTTYCLNHHQYSRLKNSTRSLAGSSPWGHTESDTTEQLIM